MHLVDPIIVVLISKRRHDTLFIAPGIARVASRALLTKYGAPQLDSHAVTSLCARGRGQSVQIRCDVVRHFRGGQTFVERDVVYGRFISRRASEMSHLPDEIGEPLSSERRYGAVTVAIAL